MKANWDQPVEGLSFDELTTRFGNAGMAPSLLEFLVPPYAEASGATFFNGAFRIHPADGFKDHGLPSLVTWNHAQGWKQFEDSKANDTFYFCSNSFGDLFGIPVTAEREKANDRVGMLWVEKYEYQEAGIEWKHMISRLFSEPGFANYFARLEQHEWLVNRLGRPAAWQCFSSNVPQILGGPNTLENISIQSLGVHVSFTLQLLKQWKEKTLVPGTPVSMVDLYDNEGNLILR